MKTSGKERRKFFRHPIQVPIRLAVAEDKKDFRSESGDMSLGGLNFTWPRKISRGTLLNITIPVKEKLFELRGKVVYSKEDKKTAFYRMGVSFIDFPSAFKARLAEEVLEIMEYRKSLSKELGYDLSEEEAASRWVREFAPRFPSLA